MQPPSQQNHRAFTLIEMVAALVLASLMMVGLLRIVTMVSMEANQLRSEPTDGVAAGMLADRMREDLVNARGMIASKDSLTLAGYVSSTNLPGRIRYDVTAIGTRRVLVRRLGNESELCWLDFGGFVIESFEDIDGETPVPEMTGGLPPMPSDFRIAALDGQGRVLFSETLHHHAD